MSPQASSLHSPWNHSFLGHGSHCCRVQCLCWWQPSSLFPVSVQDAQTLRTPENTPAAYGNLQARIPQRRGSHIIHINPFVIHTRSLEGKERVLRILMSLWPGPHFQQYTISNLEYMGFTCVLSQRKIRSLLPLHEVGRWTEQINQYANENVIQAHIRKKLT